MGDANGIAEAGTSNNYDMYFSHTWVNSPTAFPSSGAITPVQIKFLFTLTYPPVVASTRSGKRNFYFHKVRVAASSMQIISPSFALGELRAAVPDAAATSTNVALIAALAAVGAVLCAAAATVTVFVVVRRRRRGHAQKAAAAAASGTVYQQTADFL